MLPVLFDLDGTLIDSLPSLTDAVNALLAKRNLPSLPQSTVAGFVGMGEQVLIDRLVAATELDAAERSWILGTFMQIYKREAQHTRCFHGVEKALATIKGAGNPLGLVTNKPRGPLGVTLSASGLSESFDVIVAGDDLPRRKPDPLPLIHAMQVLGAETCLYVGDSEVDAETAQAAGVDFALFTEGIRRAKVHDIPHIVAFSDFGMLPSIVRRMARE